MARLIDQLNLWSPTWADAMWAVAWQSIFLIGVVAAACWMLRWQSPALRHWLWLILSTKLILMPFWRIDLPAPAWLAPAAVEAAPTGSPRGVVAPSSVADAGGATAPLSDARPVQTHGGARPVAASLPRVTWTTWLLAAWIAFILVEATRVAVQYARLRRLLRKSRPAEASVCRLVERCAQSIGLSKPPSVRQVRVEGSPMVCGLWKPTLVLPETLAEESDGDALRQIVFHELAHLKRRDLITVWILHAMRTIYWFHPGAHWVAYRAGLDRELACDHLALTHSGVSVAAYAHTLIDAAGRAAQPMVLNAAVAAGLDGGQRLEARTQERRP